MTPRFLYNICVWLWMFSVLLPVSAMADAAPESRTLVSFYDSKKYATPRQISAHRFLEMPANHLGFDIKYYDINAPLPDLNDSIRGIVLWFNPGASVPDAKLFLDWLEQQIAKGKKLIIIESAGLGDKQRQQQDIMRQYNRILSNIGVQDSNLWHSVTYHSHTEYMDPSIAGFERQIGPVFPPFGSTYVIGDKATSHLKISITSEEEKDTVDLITTNPNGGFIAEGFAIFEVFEGDESKVVQWFVNPFTFLKKALGVAPLTPVPDITTFNGRRIFYSHIDGDGWNNLCEINKYAKKKTLSAEVIRQEILKPYKDFAFSVGLITAEIDPACYGLPDSEKIARDIYALPNVEPSSHTHSHPLSWRYFEHYTPEKEEPILGHYPEKPKNMISMIEYLKDKADTRDWKSLTTEKYETPPANEPEQPATSDDEDEKVAGEHGLHSYETPRSYACAPFSLDQEITGSIDIINKLSPPNKKAILVQWSGNTSPFEGALKHTREAGFYNINGGDSRFDNEYPSYASIAPIGLHLGNELQIYSSNSNENTYTNLWTGRFFGFRYLQKTIQNTEEPLRVRPFNIYFHMYSGEKQASLNAVRENLEFARTQKLIPITTSHYTAIANGFYSTQLSKLSENIWKVSNRGFLNTIRFDDASNMSVDFEGSTGVWGQNYLHNSLYIHLDPEVEDPTIKLKINRNSNILPIEPSPYLVDSRWEIKSLHNDKNLLTIRALGYGAGEMTWTVPESGSYLIQAHKKKKNKPVYEKLETVGSDGALHFTVDVMSPEEPLTITVQKVTANVND